MLNADALQQLSQLKKTIQDNKDYAEGIVRGTANRFGFVMLDDGREAFLPPEEMQQVLPGDRVRVSLTENDKKKHEAKLEKLIGTELKTFVGEYVEKGNNHFVSADHPQLSRWFFVPPKQRKGFKSGDLVSCRIARHPFGDGKAQTQITARIGRLDEAGIERLYMMHKHGLSGEWSEAALRETEAIKTLMQGKGAALDRAGREDLTALGFVTIDAESTQDMDDALYLETVDEGWLLYTAIADPAAFVSAGSALDTAARQRAASVYFPGQPLPMFPNELSQDAFSLLAGAERLALVCRQRISPAGEILEFSFSNAVIRSRHKLSYNQVAGYLENGSGALENGSGVVENGNGAAVPDDCAQLLGDLYKLATARRQYRQANHVVLEDKFDYVFRLNRQQKIETVERRQPTLAHQVVEEAMLATNCCAGRFFAGAAERLGRASGGLFSSHAGFRTERLAEIEQLLKKDKPGIEQLLKKGEPLSENEPGAEPLLENRSDTEPADLTVLENYRQLIRTLQQDAADSALLATLKRRLQPANVSPSAAPHFGLGFECYATITSPIRRYQDLHNHRVIKTLLEEEALSGQADDTLLSFSEALQTQIVSNRRACRQVEHWLLCQFLADKKGQTFDATIVSVASQGIVVRLSDTGAEGFIPLRGSKKNPPKYDSLRMTLTHEEVTYHLEQSLRVTLDKVDLAAKQLQLSLSQSESPVVADTA